MHKPRIAVLQSMRADEADTKIASRVGPFFTRALKNQGFLAYELDPYRSLLELKTHNRLILTNGNALDPRKIDGLIWRARIFPEYLGIGRELQELLQRDFGVVKMEDPASLRIAASKILSNQFFLDNGLPTPNTSVIEFAKIATTDFAAIFAKHAHANGAVFAKVEYGSDGNGAGKFYSAQELREFINAEKQNIVVQDLVANHDRTTLRVDIVDGKIVNMMRFHPKGDSDKSNSGKVEHLNSMPQEVLDLAMRAYKASGLFFAGIDIIEDKNGKLYVLECQMPAVHYLGEHRDKTLNEVIYAFAGKVMLGKSAARDSWAR